MIAVLVVKKTQMGGMVDVDSLRAYPDILGGIRIFSAVLVANSATNTALLQLSAQASVLSRLALAAIANKQLICHFSDLRMGPLFEAEINSP